MTDNELRNIRDLSFVAAYWGAARPRKPASCSVRRSALCSRGETENRIRWTPTRPTPASLCERYVTAL